MLDNKNITKVSNDIRPIPVIFSEEDTPLDDKKIELSESKLNNDEVGKLEKMASIAERMQVINIKEKAYKLIILLVIILFILYVFDTISINFGWKSSTMQPSLFELLKISVSTLVGFLFANKISNK